MQQDTLASRILNTFGRTPKLVHRLDRQTSGISLVAFDNVTRKALHDALKIGTKVYYALCRNSGEAHLGKGPFIIDRPLRRKNVETEELCQDYQDAKTEVSM
mmetsp:Transcript_25888/g.83514  ORF Transcript_25888/g.83514 Transcript_25888/m.83514 type:complete len:102 (+) Transcript_25888:472-777(+)